MRFNINGQYLDLYEGTSLQFKRTNSLFAFDNIEVSRSTSFEIPATAHNNALFELANDPAQAGERGRVRIEAQMQAAGVALNGYLYITNSTRTEYTCMFVFGELLKLKEIKDAGDITEYLRLQNTCLWGDDGDLLNAHTAAARDSTFTLIRYDNAARAYFGKGIMPLPAIDMWTLIERAAAYFGVTVEGVQSGLKIIPPKLYDIEAQFSQALKWELTTQGAYLEQYEMTTDVPSEWFTLTAYEFITKSEGVIFPPNRLCDCVQTTRAMRVKFPSDFSDSYFMYNPRTGEYYGGWSLDTSTLQGVGTPLAGQTVEIPNDAVFLFVSSSCYDISYKVFYKCEALSTTLEVLNYADEVKYGEYVPIQPNLPDITFIDLLKSNAMIAGRAINYNESSKKIRLEDLDFDTWTLYGVSESELLEFDDVERVVTDFAQSNVVKFDSADYVAEDMKDTDTYKLYNDNAEELKEIYTIPFNEGALRSYVVGITTLYNTYIDDTTRKVEVDSEGVETVTYEIDGKKFSLLQCPSLPFADDMTTYLQQPQFARAKWLERLLDKSTKIHAEIKCPLMYFQQADEHLRLLIRGQQYVWTSGIWSGGVASVELQKI